MIWEREWDFHQGVIRGMPEDGWHIKIMQVLLSTEDKLLEAILEGNLQKAKKSDRDLGYLFHQLRSKGDEQPCQFMFEFVDGNGESPSLHQILDIAKVAERYIDSDLDVYEMVKAVDDWNGGGWDS